MIAKDEIASPAKTKLKHKKHRIKISALNSRDIEI